MRDPRGGRGQTWSAPLAASIGVPLIPIVFGRLITAIPDGLVALIGATADSALAELPHIGLRNGSAQATSRSVLRLSTLLVILAQAAHIGSTFVVNGSPARSEVVDEAVPSWPQAIKVCLANWLKQGAALQRQAVRGAVARSENLVDGDLAGIEGLG
jgi:hypothetical protein